MRPGRCILLVCIPSAEKGRNFRKCPPKTERIGQQSCPQFWRALSNKWKSSLRRTTSLTRWRTTATQKSRACFRGHSTAIFFFFRPYGRGGTARSGSLRPPLPTVRIIFEPRGWPRGNMTTHSKALSGARQRVRDVVLLNELFDLFDKALQNCGQLCWPIRSVFGGHFLKVCPFSADGMHTKSMHLPGRT